MAFIGASISRAELRTCSPRAGFYGSPMRHVHRLPDQPSEFRAGGRQCVGPTLVTGVFRRYGTHVG